MTWLKKTHNRAQRHARGTARRGLRSCWTLRPESRRIIQNNALPGMKRQNTAKGTAAAAAARPRRVHAGATKKERDAFYQTGVVVYTSLVAGKPAIPPANPRLPDPTLCGTAVRQRRPFAPLCVSGPNCSRDEQAGEQQRRDQVGEMKTGTKKCGVSVHSSGCVAAPWHLTQYLWGSKARNNPVPHFLPLLPRPAQSVLFCGRASSLPLSPSAQPALLQIKTESLGELASDAAARSGAVGP